MSAKPQPYAAPAVLVSLALMVTFAGVALVASSGAAVAAKQPKCGDTIKQDTTLHKDLVNCPNNGIVIGANGVTLDLNGHTIDGDGTPDKSCNPVKDFCDFGVGFQNHDGITVKNGSIRQFESGVGAFGAGHAQLLALAASRNHLGGFGLGGDARILVRSCSGNRSTAPEGDGIDLFQSRHVRVMNSSFRHNAHVGIKPIGSTNSVIQGNLLARNGDEGLLMEGGEGFQIRHNRVVQNGAGITLGPGSGNVISRNHVAGGRDGIRIEKGHRNLVAHNAVVGADQAGIRLGITHPFLGGAHNTVRANLVIHSHGDGFVVVRKDRHSRLKHNTAVRSGDDGFDIASRSATITANRALRNGDLGFKAVRGVKDGGGNVAHHNGDPRQCTNIVCN